MRVTAFRRHRPGRLGALGALLAGLVVMSGFATGCDDSQGAASDAVLVPQTGGSGSDVGPLGPPTLDELVTRLSLTDAQAAEIGPALERLRARFEERREQFEARRDQMRAGYGPHRGEGPGPGSGFEQGESPRVEFLAVCGSVLDTDQFVELMEFLQERRRERFQQAGERGGRHGRGGMGMMLGGLLRELDLSLEQREAVRDAMPEIGERLRDLWRQFADQEISAEALRDGLGQVRADIESTLRSILDAEQFGALEAAVEQRRTEFAERRLERVGDGIEHRVRMLTRVLQLSQEQAGQVRSTLEGFVPRQKEILQGIADGSLDFEDAVYQGILLRREVSEAIRGLLTEDQTVRFDALGSHGGPRGRHIPFFI